ncbi:hypothetical protein P6144_04090 [Sphingomonas sp. HITSZ_GF]|uniref:hypothetical protein n=1 Tax=Sphingomonas sp. HITSZ_GF TaxID=3037247 RepID=UPI00240E2985|nr:hypothetical protein [Sphingomonas sp. HITSZ_GF]MDG2532815.1 hypothetical protein [Sphingomonas sp. HITSZ_GF]
MAFRKNVARGARVSLAAIAVACTFAVPVAAQTAKTQGKDQPDVAGTEKYVSPSTIGYVTLRNWAARVESAAYTDSGYVSVTISFRNVTKAPIIIPLDFKAELLTSAGQKFDTPGVSGSQGGYVAPGNSQQMTFKFQVGLGAQGQVKSIALIERVPVPLSKTKIDAPKQELAVPPRGRSEPVVKAVTNPADLEYARKIAGTYLTNSGTLLTVSIDGAKITGKAVSNDAGRQAREQLELTYIGRHSHYVDTTGNWREEKAGKVEWKEVSMTFSLAAGDTFSAFLRNKLATDGQVSYTGKRVPDPQPQQPSGGGAQPVAGVGGASGVFKKAGPFELRMDAAGRRSPTGQYEIAMTARNKGARLALQHFDIEYYAVGSTGIEYKWVKNFYGQSGDDKLEHTVWMENGEQAAVTFAFPAVPKGVMPQKMRVRDMMSGDLLGEFNLAGLPVERPDPNAAPTGDLSGTLPGTAVKLEHYDATLHQLMRDAYGNWEAEVSFTNTSGKEITLSAGDMNFTIFAGDNSTRYAARSFFQARNTPRRGIPDTLRLAPGKTQYIRLWIPQSANVTPVRYKFQEYGGAEKGGSLPATFLNKPN